MLKKALAVAVLLLSFCGLASAQQNVTIVSGVATLDVERYSKFKVLLNQNVTSVVISPSVGVPNGTTISILFVENSSGGFTVTFGGNTSGTCTVNSAANQGTSCTLQFDSPSNTWFFTGGGGGASGNSIAPPMGYYLAPTGQCPTSSAWCFATPANVQQSALCTYTSPSTTVTCTSSLFKFSASVASNVATYTAVFGSIYSYWAVGNSITVTNFSGADTFFNQTCTLTAATASSISCALTHANASSTTFGNIANASAGPFVAGDVGKRIFGYASCRDDITGGQPMVTTPTTISAFVNSTQVTISQGAVSSPSAGQACVIWGNPDDTAAAAIDAAMSIAPQCPRGHWAAANYLFTTPHFYVQPKSCSDAPPLGGSPNFGNLLYSAGVEWDGRGPGTVNFYLTPSFPETGSCTNGLSLLACFAVPLEGKMSHFHINGGGNLTSANFTGTHNLIEVDGPASLDNFTCTNFGAQTNNTVGLALYAWAQLQQVNISGCGDWSVATSPTSAVTAFRLSVENPRTFGARLGALTDYATQNIAQFETYGFTCYDCFWFTQGLLGSSMALVRLENGTGAKFYHNRFSKYIGGLGVNTIVALQNFGANLRIDVQDSYIDMTAGGTSTSSGDIGLNCQGAGGIFVLKNNLIKGTGGGGGAYIDSAACKVLSEGGNRFGAFTTVNAGTLLSLHPTDDLSGASGFTPTCPTVTGAGATGSCAAVAGSTNEKGTLRITVAGAGPAATGTVTMNFVGTFQFSTTPSCTFTPALTGGGAWNARATAFLSTRSSTAPVITWDNNAAALTATTWDIDYACAVR